MSSWWIYLLLPVIGFGAGFINTLAGGGSFITLPALIYLLGLPPQIANATNRFSVVFYTSMSTGVFHKHGYADYHLTGRLLLPSILGSISGAYLAAILPGRAFSFVFGISMIGMAVLFLLKPKVLLEVKHEVKRNVLMEVLCFFLIGLYGGFMQAGVGLLLLAGIAIFHSRDLVSSNAVKVGIALVYAVCSVSMFAYHGQIRYVEGGLLAAGAMLGALTGAKMAIKKGTRFIFYVVIVIAVITGVSLIYESFAAMM